MNKILSIIFLLFPKIAFAIPLPQIATAVISVSEILFFLLTVLAIYFPFARKMNKKNLFLYLLLILSIGLNIYYITPQSSNKEKEDRPGMLWTETERLNDKYSIEETKAYEILKSNSPNYVFADVRTTAEKELGSPLNFEKLKWQEIAENKEVFKDKKIIVTCWTGMRGSEICSKLRELGIDCYYLRSGIKRWVELGLPTQINGNKEFFGSIPYFNNAEKYLTPEETKSLISKKALIIDGRSEREFNQQHIPNAINIPFMDLTDADLNYKIVSLPVSKEGIIVSCFGLISCSEASSLGWEFNKLGFNYLGAYGAGAVLLKNSENVENWSDKIKFTVKKYLDTNLNKVFIILLLITFWILIKKTTLLSLNQDITLLKKSTYSVISIFSTVIYYYLIDIFSSILSIDLKYNNFIMILGTLIISYSLITLLNYKKVGNFLIIVFIYIGIMNLKPEFVCTLISIIILEKLLSLSINGLKKLKNNYKKNKIFIELKESYELIGDNGKAGKLAYFTKKGYKVPKSFIIYGRNIKKIESKDINYIIKNLGLNIAIRSSAKNEDSINNSQAGLNLSIIKANLKNLKNDIKNVLKSYSSKSPEEEIVLLQEVINPIFAGTIFSKHPNQGGALLIEFCEGLSDDLMSGKKQAYSIVLNTLNGDIVEKDNNLLDKYIAQLYSLVKNLENDLKYPVDIEWAIDENGIWLIQVRYQTGLENLYINSVEKDKDKLSQLKYLQLETTELSMVLRGIKPLSASLVINSWKTNSLIHISSKMAYWKWNKEIEFKYSQTYYQYAFYQLWASAYPLLKLPNKLSYLISKLVFKQNWNEMKEIKNKIIKDFNLYKNINFEKLDNIEMIQMYKDTLKNWRELERQAMYIHFMAESSLHYMKKYMNELSLPIYNQEEYAYYSNKEYFLEEKRNIELNQNNLKENLYLEVNKHTSKVLSDRIKKEINFTRELIVLREVSKYDSLKTFYLLRQCLLAIKTKLNLGEEFWHLEEDEVEKLFTDKKIISSLKHRVYKIEFELPEKIDHKNLMKLENIIKSKNKINFVSMPKEIKGVVEHINIDSENLENTLINLKNKIIYVKYMTPKLILLCNKYKIETICSYYGSMLSHPSVLAREFGITCLIGLELENINEIHISAESEIINMT